MVVVVVVSSGASPAGGAACVEGSGAGGSVVRGPGADGSGAGAAGGTTIQFADRTVTVFDAPTAVSVNVHTPVLVVDPDRPETMPAALIPDAGARAALTEGKVVVYDPEYVSADGTVDLGVYTEDVAKAAGSARQRSVSCTWMRRSAAISWTRALIRSSLSRRSGERSGKARLSNTE